MPWSEYFWSRNPESDSDEDLGVVPIPDPILLPVEENLDLRIAQLEAELQKLRKENNNLRSNVSDYFLKWAKVVDSNTIYHRVTFGIISVVPLTNCFIRQDMGIILSVLSFSVCLMVSSFSTLAHGHQKAEIYRNVSKDMGPRTYPNML
jgi:hypothetical protein